LANGPENEVGEDPLPSDVAEGAAADGCRRTMDCIGFTHGQYALQICRIATIKEEGREEETEEECSSARRGSTFGNLQVYGLGLEWTE